MIQTPTQIPEENLTDHVGMLSQIVTDLLTPVNPPLLATGTALWQGLATIVVVWTGLKIAFSGSFQPWDVVRAVIGLWIPWSMLLFYDQPIPGVGLTFPMMITAGGNWLAAFFGGDMVDMMFRELTALYANHGARMSAAWEALSLRGILLAGGGVVLDLVVTLTFAPFVLTMLTVIFVIGYAQVIWATLATSILVFLGPMMIPWLVFEPMKFLFWGWFRAMVTYALYFALAGCMFRVWGEIALDYATTLNGVALTGENVQGLLLWMLALIPLMIAAVLSTMKIGELAGMLVSGGGASGSGFLGMVGSATGILASGSRLRTAGKTGKKG